MTQQVSQRTKETLQLHIMKPHAYKANKIFFNLPKMTDRGTFIINGIERAVINQIVRSPGAYFSGELDPSSGRVLYKAEVRPLHGSWLEFETTRGDVIYARIDRRRKVLATTFIKAS